MKSVILLLFLCILCGCRGVITPAPVPLRTEFAAPTTIPSVSQSINAASTPISLARSSISDARQIANQLTPPQPTLSTDLNRAAGAIEQIASTINKAIIIAAENDSAAASLRGQLDQARTAVTQKDKQIANVAAQLAKARDAQHQAQRWWGSIVIGILIAAGVYELGLGFVVAGIVGAFAFMGATYVLDSAIPWLPWIALGLAAALIVFGLESKAKGGMLPAIADQLKPKGVVK